jgi:hypothetical protein
MHELTIEYDPIMRDEDQHKEFFSLKTDLSVYIEEINNRNEFTIEGKPASFKRL